MDLENPTRIRTPAGYSRQLYAHKKAMIDDLLANGYNVAQAYHAMLQALARVAYQEGGDARLHELSALLPAVLDETWMRLD